MHNMKDSIRTLSLFQYSIATITLVLIMLGLFSFLGTDKFAMNSFLMESICFLLLTMAASFLYLGNKKLVVFFSLAYVIKLLIGLFHYLIFIDPNYFSSTGNIQMLHYEFQAVMDFLEYSVSEKEQNGLFYFSLGGIVTHQELLSLIAIPLKFFGVKILNIAPINSFFSLWAAINIYMLTKQRDWNPATNKWVLLILAYFPATLITSYFFRDIVGWAFISVGLVLMIKAKNIVSQIITMLVAMLLFYLQRSAYVVLPMAIFIAQYAIVSKKKEIWLALVALLAASFALPYVIDFSFATSDGELMEGAREWPIYLIPIKFIVGLIGPFPWTNFFMWHETPEASYYLSDYLMGCLNMAFVFCLLLYWKSFIYKGRLAECTIVGIILLIMGIMNKFMHMTYISIGVFFMVPWFIERTGVKRFKSSFIYAFVFLFFLNIIFIFLGLSGVGSIVR